MGYPIAQNNLGVTFKSGEGMTQNCKFAVAWYEHSAIQQYTIAKYNLGMCYDLAINNDQDFFLRSIETPECTERGLLMNRDAAVCGFSEAQVNLGFRFQSEKDIIGLLS